MKQYIIPGILILLSLIMLIGGAESRAAKANFFGKTLFFPMMHSLRQVQTNAELRTELNNLQKGIAMYRLDNLALQNQIALLLNSAHFSFYTGSQEFTVAEVIGYSGQFQQRNLIVNKGRLAGVAVDDPVISSEGIVGKVISVTDTYCVILPFSNPDFQLPVMNQAASVQGILNADITGTISMNLIKLGSEISAGDTIVSSNLSRLFPKGFPVGKVSRLRESQDNLFISAELVPFTLVENLEHVFILKNPPKGINS